MKEVVFENVTQQDPKNTINWMEFKNELHLYCNVGFLDFNMQSLPVLRGLCYSS